MLQKGDKIEFEAEGFINIAEIIEVYGIDDFKIKIVEKKEQSK